ncbi:MAG: Gldg family protein [Prolixibacteraceae bacterium]|nr:Gldg family protein [Prolixibacteraceae bacterium]MDD4756435.1 Gldg family protein [Prolixibacteraceae bacterium]
MNRKNSIVLYILLVAGILVLINILAARFFYRLDLTEDKRYTLSDATKDVLKNLEDPVTVSAYFSEGLPPNIDKARRDFKELLSEFETHSRGNIVYEFINPNKDEEIEQEAIQNGISPVVINVREKDQSVQKKAFLGAILKYGEKTEVIPFVQPGSAMEYSIASGIKKLTLDEKNLVGFIQGHGEPSTFMMQQAMQSLNVLNEVEGVNLTDSTYLPKYKTLALIAPTDSIPGEHFRMLDDYLAGGGNMVIAVNRVDGDLNQGMGTDINTGLESWLAEKGIEVESSFIVDVNCGAVSVVQQQGMFSFTTQVDFPFLPVFNTFNEHPVTSGLETVIMQFASPVNYTGDSALTFTPLVYSSEKSGIQGLPLFFNIEKKWGDNDFPMKGIVAAGVLEGNIAGTNNARMIVIGDGDFAVNGQGQQAQQLSPDNVNLLVNSIDWLSDDTGLIQLRTRGITSRLLKQVEDGKKNLLKWLNVLLPVIFIIVYGIFRSQRNRVIREKRRLEHYNR